ncbi:MAG TPA: hypothetical protein VKU19_37315 [Bryobacteraceae bacterium]|nr:hypothetical protein [Bryobacteraceae bacterium]
MNTHFLLAALFLAGQAAYAADSTTVPTANSAAAFSRLKTLVGEWEADTDMGKVHLSYDLIAGGTALIERFTSEKEPPMLTVYHINGNHLMLTHYCTMGNQPRMQAASFDPQTGELQFQFLDATNLGSAADGHMHSAKIRLVDHDHMVSEWQFYEKSAPKFTETAHYTRIK